MTKAKKQRHKQGVTYHAWAWKAGKTWERPGELFWRSYFEKPSSSNRPTSEGKWVRVKFVEVD